MPEEIGQLVSRFELVKNDVMAEFALISTDNEYRTAGVKVVGAIRRQDLIIQGLSTGVAEIGVHLGNAKVSDLSSNWTSFEATIDVWVQAVIQTEASSEDAAVTLNKALEGLRQDMLKVCAVMGKKYINNFKGRWNILRVPIEVVPSTDLGNKYNVGAVALKFQAQLRAMDGTFK
jgi:hypothetical protein